MENATKALLMAGSILLTILIIGAVVLMYQDLASVQKQNQKNVAEQQETEFNRTYTVFERQLYGSELLSLVNKAIDYDNKIDQLQNGYTKMTIEIELTNSTGTFLPAGIYRVTNANNVFKTKIDKVEQVKGSYGGDRILQRLSAQASLNTIKGDEELEKILTKELGKTVTPGNFASMKAEIQIYTDYMEFKRKSFNYRETIYDTKNNNGRIVEMKYKEK